MRAKKCTSFYESLSTIAFALLICATGVAQVTVAKPPAPTVTPAGPHRQEPPGGQHPPNTAGDVEGFVYWDASAVTQQHPGTCAGLAVVVSAAGSQNNTIQLGNNFKYAGQVKAYLYGGKIVVYDVCIYAYHGQPIGPQLQAQLVITQPNQFSPNVAPKVATISPITIINAQCNMLPPIVPSSVGDLTSHWGSCQNRAYDVNFALVPSTHMLGTSEGTRGTLLNANKGAVNPGPINSPSRGMLMGGTNPGPQNSPSQGMLTGGTNPGPQQTSTHAMTSGARDSGPTQTGSGGMLVPAIKPAQPQVASSGKGTPGQLLPYRAGAPTLTNSDVIGLVKGGVPESAIINQIKSSNGQFDFSPQGCSALAQAHVSTNVLNAMGNGGASPCFTGGLRTGAGNGADDLNPQPYPPKSTNPTVSGSSGLAPLNSQQRLAALKKPSSGSLAALKPVMLGPAKVLAKVTNPRLAQQNASIIAALEQQRQTVLQDSAEIRSAAPAPGPPAGPAPALAANLQGTAPSQGIGSSSSQGPSNLRSNIVLAHDVNGVALACAHDPTPRIFTTQTPTIFTPEGKYNHYVIRGCGFGQAASGNSANISGNKFRAVKLNIDSWSENAITAHLDSSLAGVLDQNNVTLVVAPAGKPPIQQSGFKFYAARGMPGPDGSDQEVALAYDSMEKAGTVAISNIGYAGVKLYDATPILAGYNQVPKNANSQFPSFTFQGSPVAGWVFRYAYGHDDNDNLLNPGYNDCHINDLTYSDPEYINPTAPNQCADYFYSTRWNSMGADAWTFALQPGFAMSSYELYYEDTDPRSLCGAWDETSHQTGIFGKWDFNLTANDAQYFQITVNWPVYWCLDTEAQPFNRINEQKQSAYGLAVWVMGPRCVNPWNGGSDLACMTKVRQMLGS